jgi:hypothetical protein
VDVGSSSWLGERRLRTTLFPEPGEAAGSLIILSVCNVGVSPEVKAAFIGGGRVVLAAFRGTESPGQAETPDVRHRPAEALVGRPRDSLELDRGLPHIAGSQEKGGGEGHASARLLVSKRCSPATVQLPLSTVGRTPVIAQLYPCRW